uniref:Uncharacterized protein n=1 Tax=Rhizochromulina marina TaxID=1034831 RepID=A0A7S2RNG0_9STRA|mmetsp:Transcript_18807/g.54775  ORF Transcript_18807/g.54775 Transcript_18807/m.54775 type:complete len:155 (+) Transcript_18807:1-465(+)
MDAQRLWPWESSDEHCREFFSGRAFLYPDHDESLRLCRDTQTAMFGGLITFVAISLNVMACFFAAARVQQLSSGSGSSEDDGSTDGFELRGISEDSSDEDEGSTLNGMHRQERRGGQSYLSEAALENDADAAGEVSSSSGEGELTTIELEHQSV